MEGGYLTFGRGLGWILDKVVRRYFMMGWHGLDGRKGRRSFAAYFCVATLASACNDYSGCSVSYEGRESGGLGDC